MTCVHVGSLAGSVKIVSWLSNHTYCSLSDRTREGATPLHFASLSGDLATAEYVAKEAPK